MAPPEPPVLEPGVSVARWSAVTAVSILTTIFPIAYRVGYISILSDSIACNVYTGTIGSKAISGWLRVLFR